MALSRRFLDALTNSTCPETNAVEIDQSAFWDSHGVHWDAHRVGWAVAGGCAALTTVISGVNIWLHCRNYRRPLAQRQVIRILLMPVVFAIISFAGYRYFRHFIYFALVRDIYESFTLAAFLALMLLFLSDSPAEQRAVLVNKGKRKLIFPLCCWRFRPGKPAFLWVVKWSVLQFVILKPALAITSIVTEAFDVYCASSQSFKFANVYLEIVDFIAVTVSLYGLILLYALVHPELMGHRPLAKFLTIKIIVALVFYQGFVFSILEHFNVIKDTEYWTASNVSDGLNALTTTVEMVLIALFQLYAYPASEFKPQVKDDRPRTSVWRSFLHSQNYSDFALDIFYSLKFFVDRVRGKPYTRSSPPPPNGGDEASLNYRDAVHAASGFDLVKAFDFRSEAFPAPEGPMGVPLDPQRPYIAPASWASRRGEQEEEVPMMDRGPEYPPTYVASGPESATTFDVEGKGAPHHGETAKGGYMKLAEAKP